MKEKGWIALDIDGTLTLDKYSIPEEVIYYLHSLYENGWRIALATGRPFAFASMAVSKLNFPFTFLLQNGSLALDMPEKKELFKRYLSPGLIPIVEECYEGIDSDFVIYAGYEKGDFCYWRPDLLSDADHRYLDDLQKRQKESWKAVKDFKNLDPFPLIKCFGPLSRVETIAERLRARGFFEVALIRDPFEEEYQMNLVTASDASKGKSLNALFKLKGKGELVIAAGDDENDRSLLEAADIKIAMSHAPESLQGAADYIAPPTHELGIIHALQLALRNHG